MVTKQQLKSRPVVKLTFELDRNYEADTLALVSNVSNWEPLPFTKLKNGKWRLQLETERGKDVEFRYRGTRGGAVWYDNDPAADGFVPNPFGTSNAIVYC